MDDHALSQESERLLGSVARFYRFFVESRYALRAGRPGISDFVAGNPQELPLPEYVEALRRWAVPQRPDWFAYKMSEPEARSVVAASLREHLALEVRDEDVMMTTGAIGGLAAAIRVVAGRGDEVIFLSPPWFFYEALILAAGATPVRVNLPPPTFELDLDAIAAGITDRTRAIVVNSPNNPTGRIYPAESLGALAQLLSGESERRGRPIYLISDESYRRIVFGDAQFVTPARFYPCTLIVYTYGKTLLAPGQRVGYVAWTADMPSPDKLREAFFAVQLGMGFAFPNALLQHALSDLERLSIDIKQLERKRDRMVEALRTLGYEVQVPDGTFYVMPRSPIPDDVALMERLAEMDVFVLPGMLCELPGYFRISLTATEEMIERSLPAFETVRKEARA
ncbi:MAG: aminotransferase class I/II-fold pyridoxal phosphate-dependent enzyme [Actinomycetota bacterium]